MKLFIQYAQNKFVNSLSDIVGDIGIAIGTVDNNLYKIHYGYNFDSYIFHSDLLTNEIYQFIDEFKNSHKIILYHHNTVNKDIISKIPTAVHISDIESEDCIQIPNLVNKHIFYQNDMYKKERENIYVCFLDNYNSIPPAVHHIIYPHSDIKLRLFSKNIKHQQNFGYATELEKAKILNTSQYYIDIDNSYRVEAQLCGAKILKLKDKTLEEDLSDLPKYKTYAEFIESIL